ncbi:MAG: hypothetical protein ACOY45_02745 [Pseudomonadota bacterium]
MNKQFFPGIGQYRNLLVVGSAIGALVIMGNLLSQPSETQQNMPSEGLPTPMARFDVAQVNAMEEELRREPKILDMLTPNDGNAVDWQIMVSGDGSSRVGYASYICSMLRDRGLVDDRTSVRIVDYNSSAAASGDLRGASLGHIRCSDDLDMGL